MYQDIKNLFSKQSDLKISKLYKYYLASLVGVIVIILVHFIVQDKMELRFKKNNELFLCKKISFVKKQTETSIDLTDGSSSSSKYLYSLNEKFCLKYDYLRYFLK